MEELKRYLKQMLGETVVIEPYSAKNLLSAYLSGSYEIYTVQILDIRFFLAKSLEERTVAQLQIQIARMEEKLKDPVAVYAESISRYQLRRFLSEKTPFICGDKQMFLPFLGLYLQKTYREKIEEKMIEHFTPAMQLTYLWILYSQEDAWTQQELSRQLNVTAMTVSRTLDAFVNLGLLEYSITGSTGRKKVYKCRDKKAYYEAGKIYLANPVKKTFYADTLPPHVTAYAAGLSALAKKTMLGEPELSTVAVCAMDAAKIKEHQIPKRQALEEHLYEVQEMKYDFSLLTKDESIDPVSLVYSLREKDERIELAIDEVMGEYVWYEV